MIKDLFFLSKLFLLSLFLFPHFGFSWNSMCHSPVQVASFLSSPRSQRGSSLHLRQAVTKKEKQIDTVYERLDDIEGDLANFLDANKLKQDSSDVAGQIKGYMESQSDGWDCVIQEQIFLFQAPFFNLLSHILIPEAFGEIKEVQLKICPKGVVPLDGECWRKKDQTSKGKVTSHQWCETASGHGSYFSLGQNCCSKENPRVKPRCLRSSIQKNRNQKEMSQRVQENISQVDTRRDEPAITGELQICPPGSEYPKARFCCPRGQKLFNEICQDKGVVCKLQPKPGTWYPKAGICCPRGKKLVNKKCVEGEPSSLAKSESEKWEAPSVSKQGPKRSRTKTKTAKTKCEKYDQDWKQHEAFSEGGEVESSFCDDYASSKKECKKALKKINKYLAKLAKLEERKSDLEDQLNDAEISAFSDEKTEANGLCFDCLKKVLANSAPTAGDHVGNTLNMLLGVGIGSIGYQYGQRIQEDANMLRIQQGYGAQDDFYSLQGASMGFPYISQGLYGLTRSNTPRGGFTCSPSASPHGYPYNYQHGQGFNMGYY